MSFVYQQERIVEDRAAYRDCIHCINISITVEGQFWVMFCRTKINKSCTATRLSTVCCMQCWVYWWIVLFLIENPGDLLFSFLRWLCEITKQFFVGFLSPRVDSPFLFCRLALICQLMELFSTCQSVTQLALKARSMRGAAGAHRFLAQLFGTTN